jgi:hypothetical protein
MPESQSQVCSALLMVRPKAFGYNAETAQTNRFQQPGSAGDVAARAMAEFDAFAAALASEGITICVAEDSAEPRKPDAVFPNNWVSFHADGTVVLYPMQAESRRAERRMEIIDAAVRDTGFTVRRVLDLTSHEKSGRFLEGTGSLVLDHLYRVAYACISPRTDAKVAAEWAAEMGFELELFSASDATGTPIYHTNVVMSIGTRAAIVALDNIASVDRARVAERLSASGREVIAIDPAEMHAFAGNMLEVGSWDEHLGDFRVLVMSRTARQALAPKKLAQLTTAVDSVLAAPIDVIERHGGGSVRCMLAEVFLR